MIRIDPEPGKLHLAIACSTWDMGPIFGAASSTPGASGPAVSGVVRLPISQPRLLAVSNRRNKPSRTICVLVQKWLKAGMLDKGRHVETDEGTPQGAVISPLLANI